MKKSTSRGLFLALAAGLATSSAAHAQFVIAAGSGTFTDISATGTAITTFTSPDDGTAAITSSVTNALVTSPTLNVCTNGFISTPAQTYYPNTPLPMSGATFALCPFWDDLYVDGPGSVRYQSVVEGGINVFIVQWDHVRTFDGGTGSGTGTFEVKIFGSGPTLVQYLYSDLTFIATHTNGVSATVGAQFSATGFTQFSANTASLSNGMVLSITVDNSTGACCLPNFTCLPNITGASCIAQGGVYQGANSLCSVCPTPPVPGGCCMGGSCSFILASACFATGNNVWYGENTTCSVVNCSPVQYTFDDGSMEDALGPTVTGGVGFANQFVSVAGKEKISRIQIGFGVYAALNGLPITVCIWSDPNGDGMPDDAHVLASIPGQIIGANAVFSNAPNWVSFDIPDTTIPAGQNFFVGFIMQNAPSGQFPCGFDTGSAAGHSWWGYNAGPFDPNAWAGEGELTALGFPGNWMIRCDAGPAGSACYANCDASSSVPCLNVLDFSCFLNAFAAGSSYANCDNSTNVPVLNVLDFSCFLNSFAAGCSSC